MLHYLEMMSRALVLPTITTLNYLFNCFPATIICYSYTVIIQNNIFYYLDPFEESDTVTQTSPLNYNLDSVEICSALRWRNCLVNDYWINILNTSLKD